jgi:hypothetical protein
MEPDSNNSITTWISCGSNNNAFESVCVKNKGSLVEVIGHKQMEFTLPEAIKFATAIVESAERAGFRFRD